MEGTLLPCTKEGPILICSPDKFFFSKKRYELTLCLRGFEAEALVLPESAGNFGFAADIADNESQDCISCQTTDVQ